MATCYRYLRVCAKDTFRIKRGKTIKTIDIAKIALVFLLATNVKLVNSSENETDNKLPKQLRVIEAIAGRGFLSDIYSNGTFRTGNSLWDNLLNKCTVKPSVSCLQNNFYSYLNKGLEFDGDVNVGGSVCFKKNNVDIDKYSKEANVIYLTGSKDQNEDRSLDEENEIDDEEESETPLEEVTDSLYDRGVKFLVTHDMKLKLPELFFHGATLKVSPRALTKTGALVHIDLEPDGTNGEGRLFFNKIKKYIKKKLLMAALAIILVIKLIALKLIFVLPLILGVTTAKKMFLKLLLFLFPALSHIFKLCSWYHQNYHTTKFHHHHHQITHHHKRGKLRANTDHMLAQAAPRQTEAAHAQAEAAKAQHASRETRRTPHHHAPAYHSHQPYHPSSTVVVRPHSAGPPSSVHGPSFEHYPQDWELSGPGLGNEYIASGIHRNAIATFKPDMNDANDINAWGLGLPPGQSMNVGEYSSTNNAPTVAQPPGNKTPYGNAGRPVGPQNPYRNKKNTSQDPLQAEKDALIRAAALAARAPPSAVRDEVLRVSAAKLSESNRLKADDLLRQQMQSQDPDTMAADKFYGALLAKVDHILSSIGATDLGCNERAVCALYREPFKHVPYSNLVSNELSKDSNELLPPADSKMALRYYVYVQAARDGQEQKDCVTLYPNCNIDYNKK